MIAAYYNEINPYAAQWLRNLIAAKHIASGDVDERSVVDVQPDDLRGYSQCHFFAGIGGWSHALRLAGWPDSRSVWTGSCPCQPISGAGQRRGHADQRHLWPAFHRLIAECRPSVVFGEQVAGADGREWLAAVRADLEATGYAVGAADLCAAGVGAPHIRQRLFFVADANGGYASAEGLQRGWEQRQQPEDGDAGLMANAAGDRLQAGPDISEGRVGHASERYGHQHWADIEWLPCLDGKARPTQPGIFPLAHGVPSRMGRLRAYGNAIVPQVAAEFIRAVSE